MKLINKREILEIITPVIDTVCESLGLIAVEVTFTQESGRHFVRIYIYNPKQPVSHTDCENVTRKLADYLDELIPVNYYLEVSSPGLERKLKTEKEYLIFQHKKVHVKLKKELEDEKLKVFDARIEDYSEEKGLSLKIIDLNKVITVKHSDISTIQLIFEQHIKGENND